MFPHQNYIDIIIYINMSYDILLGPTILFHGDLCYRDSLLEDFTGLLGKRMWMNESDFVGIVNIMSRR